MTLITRHFFTQLGILLGKVADMEQSTIEKQSTVDTKA